MNITRLKASLVLTVVISLSGWSGIVDAQTPNREGSNRRKFDFALIGDFPYTVDQEPKFLNVINDINQHRLAFTIHDGDFKSGSTLCSDEVFQRRFMEFQTFVDPFIFIFGDNEWTDCHRANNGGYDPLERLSKLREIFTAGDFSLGRRALRLARQSSHPEFLKFRENVRWTHGDVVFVGLNIPGSNNNFGRTPTADAEYLERNTANLAWVRESFAVAAEKRLRAVMLIIQANPGFELSPTDPQRTGFNDFLRVLETETLAFGKPVVLVHGDSHYFRIDKPLLGLASGSRIENFTRVETFGSPDVHWLRVTVNSNDPNVFTFRQEIVEENLVNHRPSARP